MTDGIDFKPYFSEGTAKFPDGDVYKKETAEFQAAWELFNNHCYFTTDERISKKGKIGVRFSRLPTGVYEIFPFQPHDADELRNGTVLSSKGKNGNVCDLVLKNHHSRAELRLDNTEYSILKFSVF